MKRTLIAIITIGILLSLSAIPAFASYPVQSAPVDARTYTIQRGDNLFRIALHFKVRLDVLARVNNITNIHQIYVGQVLNIEAARTGLQQPGNGNNGSIHLPAYGTIPALSLSSYSAKPGATLTISGSNYPGNRDIQLYLESRALGLKSNLLTTVKTDHAGNFTATITIPATWSNGTAVNQYALSVVGYSTWGGYWAMNSFVVG